jgi:NADH:ubiquinone oxidoreductase subunit E
MAEIQEIIKNVTTKYGKERRSLMPVLQAIVKEKNYITEDDMVSVAKELDLSAAEVYGTATFYTFLDVVPRGKFVIRVCKTTACNMLGKDEIVDSICNALKIKVGETTSNKQFTLLLTNCLGWCHKGPVMLINDEVYYELTPKKVLDILELYKTK